ncbi:glycosyltransferase [Trichocoleus desertorum AS-A10]|uniref:glycosyltransferase n=1 Tax=Trichocoleus desertorum TaxID=1481672 RepID=UPI003299274D
MKVLHVIPSVAPIQGGPSYAILAMVKALRSQGVEVEIATTNDNGPKLLQVPLNQQIEYQGVPIWFFSRFALPMKEFIFSAALTRGLWQNMQNYDLVHTHYLFSYASTCAGAIARHQKIPYIVRTIGQLSPWALAQSRTKKRLYTQLIEQRNLQQASAIHCTAPGEAEDVRKFGIYTPAITIPLGVDIPVPCPEARKVLGEKYGIAADIPVILFLSRLHYKKRPDLLLQSLSSLAKEGHSFHLCLAGAGEPDYLNYLQTLITSLDLTAQTSLTGFAADRDKEILLQGSDIFVLPSFSENFGVAVAEAMAAGLPVVITPGIQIAPDIASAQAGLVVEGEVDALAAAIAQLLNSPELRQQLGENGRRFAQSHYSWDAIAQQLAAVYTAVVQKQPLPHSLTQLRD